MIRRSIARRSGGRRPAAESVRLSRPSSTSWRIRADVNVLLDARVGEGRVGADRGPGGDVGEAAAAGPARAVGEDQVAETPGIASWVRMRSRAAWRRAATIADRNSDGVCAGVGAGLPPGAGGPLDRAGATVANAEGATDGASWLAGGPDGDGDGEARRRR